MFLPRSRRKSVGFTLVEVLTVTGLMAGLHSQGNYRYGISKANEIRGLSNLRQVYQLLMIQGMMGGMPEAAFYPKGDPKTDPKSIITLLKGAPPQLFVSPFAPPALQEKGLTFAWNDTVNRKHLDSIPGNTWLLIDLAAFIADPKVPKPSKYLILYANGRAEAVSNLPPDVQKAVEEAKAKKAEKEAEGKRKGDKPKRKPQAKKPDPPKPTDAVKRIPRIPNLPIPPNVPGL